MTFKLPSLNVLTAFEAAARHLSFKHAADELCISPPAVSHQIKVLETYLDKPLFKRLNRALELTPAGLAYYEDISGSLEKLHQATARVIADKENTTFRINSIPFITNTLLVPHIQNFRNKHPELRLSIKSEVKRTNLSQGETDVAIRHLKGDEPSLHYEKISPVFVSPVCSPEYLSQTSHFRLNDCVLIRLESDKYSWPLWMKEWSQAGHPKEELCLDNYLAVLEAVKQGAGIAMGYLPSLVPLLEKGELVLPFAKQISQFDHLYLVYPKENKNNEKILSFQFWIKQLIAETFSDKNILPEPE